LKSQNFSKSRLSSLIASALLLGCSSVSNATDFSLGASFGTLGAGVEATYALNQNLLNLRTGLYGFDYSYEVDDINVLRTTYSGDVNMRMGGAFLDFYPIPSFGFFMTGGLMYNGNEFHGTNNLYPVKSEISWNEVAPYVGIGWGNPVTSGNNPWTFTVNAGVMFMGNPHASVTAIGPLNTDFGQTTVQVLNQTFVNEVSDFRYWPSVNMGIHYSF
jgi:hypothetical protein